MAVLLIMSILSVAIFSLFTSNIATEKMQADAIKAHYIAQSGVDVAFGALLQDNQSLLEDYFNKSISVHVAPLTDTITLETGTAEIEISSYIDGTERWIMITSVGHITGSDLTQTSKMSFNIRYPQIKKWE
jgi:hypothetical protein